MRHGIAEAFQFFIGIFQGDGVLLELFIRRMQMAGLLLELNRLSPERVFRPLFFRHIPHNAGKTDQPVLCIGDWGHGQ